MTRFSKSDEPSAWLIIIVLIGTFLRFYGLGDESYSLDELDTILLCSNNFLDIFNAGKPPFFFMSESIWVRLFGYSEIGSRSLNAFVGCVSIPIMYLVGKELFNKKVGLISSYFFSVSNLMIFHSQTIRYYSFFIFFALLSVHYYLNVLRKNDTSGYIIFGFVSVLSFYNHYFGILLIIALNIHFLINIRRLNYHRTKWVICQLSIFILIVYRFLRLLLKTTRGESPIMNWVPMPDIYSPLRTLFAYIGDILSYDQNTDTTFNLSISYNTIYLAVIFVIASTAIYIYYKGYKDWFNDLRHISLKINFLDNYKAEQSLLIVWLIVPILLLMVISYCFGPVYVNSYSSASAPAFYILLGVVICRLKKVIHPSAVLGFVTILILPGLLNYYSEPQKQQFRESAYYLERNTGPEDLIIVTGHAKRRKFFWYYRGNADICLPATKKGFNKKEKNRITKCIGNRSKFWIITTPGDAEFSIDMISYLANTDRFRILDNIHFESIEIYKFNVNPAKAE